jgi:hypothetical protein
MFIESKETIHNKMLTCSYGCQKNASIACSACPFRKQITTQREHAAALHGFGCDDSHSATCMYWTTFARHVMIDGVLTIYEMFVLDVESIQSLGLRTGGPLVRKVLKREPASS